MSATTTAHQPTKKPKGTENDTYTWLLEQRFLHEAGLLRADRAAIMDETLPGWGSAITAHDTTFALKSTNRPLRRAFTSWWNSTGERGVSLTFKEIRSQSEGEM